MAIQVNGTTVIDNSRNLTNIASVDAATVAALGAAGVGGSNWYQSNWLTKSVSASSLKRIEASGNTVVVANDYNGVFYSTNNGATFTAGTSGWAIGSENAKDVAINGSTVVAVGSYSTIKRSTNYGASWGSKITATTWLNCVANNGSTFIAGGENGVYNKSTNDGVSWTSHDWDGSGSYNNIYDIATDGNGKWVMVGGSGYIAYSLDNGASFSTPTQHGFYGSIWGVATDGSGNWVYVGDNGRVGLSTNNGATWTQLPSSSTSTYNAVASDGSGNWIGAHNSGLAQRNGTGSPDSLSGGIFAGAGAHLGAAYGTNRFFSSQANVIYYVDV